MATSNPDRLDAFEGRWQLSRRIEDFMGGPEGRMEGKAVFSSAENGLEYREAGFLRLGDAAPIRAERAYLWRDAREGRVEVLFYDGRPFHGFTLSDHTEANHFCDPDMYRVAYEFGSWPRWRAVWRVTGPRKDYRMTTDYAPLALAQVMGDTDDQIDVADGRGA